VCDALILDEDSADTTLHQMSNMSLWARSQRSKYRRVAFLPDEPGIQGQAANMIVSGFIEPIVKGTAHKTPEMTA
jgi:hypothetical protein